MVDTYTGLRLKDGTSARQFELRSYFPVQPFQQRIGYLGTECETPLFIRLIKVLRWKTQRRSQCLDIIYHDTSLGFHNPHHGR